MKTNSINVYEIDLNGEKYKVIPIIESYANNGTLAIDLVIYDSLMRGEFEIFGTLTKNIPDSMFLGTSIETIDNHAYIDGNRFGFEEFVIKNKLGEYQGKKGKSGYCEYPLFKFDLDRLNTEEAVEKWQDSIIVKRNKTFDIKITQTCQQDYKVEAKSKEEAIQIAENKYENGEFDPIQDEGEIEHSVCSLDEPAKILVDKDLFERMSNHLKNYEKDIQSIILDSEERYSYSEAGDIGDPENRRHWEHLEHYDQLKAEIHSLNKEIEENEEKSLDAEEKDDFEI